MFFLLFQFDWIHSNCQNFHKWRVSSYLPIQFRFLDGAYRRAWKLNQVFWNMLLKCPFFPYASYVSFIGLLHKYHKWGGLKQQKFILLEIWRLELWNQDVHRTMIFPRNVWGRILPSLFLASGGFLQSLAFLGFRLCHSDYCLSHKAFLPLFVCISVQTFLFI